MSSRLTKNGHDQPRTKKGRLAESVTSTRALGSVQDGGCESNKVTKFAQMREQLEDSQGKHRQDLIDRASEVGQFTSEEAI